MEDDALIAQAQAWLAEDPDPDTREELARLIDAHDLPELTARFSGTSSSAPPASAANSAPAPCA